MVRLVAHLKLGDYELNDELIGRLSDHHRGVFVVGKPGSGKTTFAQAIAAHLDETVGAMVKTMEAPRFASSSESDTIRSTGRKFGENR